MKEARELIPTTFEKVVQSRAYTCIVFEAEEKRFGIYTDLLSGKAMQRYLSSIEAERPSTYDLIEQIFRSFEIKLKQFVINDLQGALYFGKLFLEQKGESHTEIVEMDARPSDCIILSLIYKIPIYCTREVLEKSIAYEG